MRRFNHLRELDGRRHSPAYRPGPKSTGEPIDSPARRYSDSWSTVGRDGLPNTLALGRFRKSERDACDQGGLLSLSVLASDRIPASDPLSTAVGEERVCIRSIRVALLPCDDVHRRPGPRPPGRGSEGGASVTVSVPLFLFDSHDTGGSPPLSRLRWRVVGLGRARCMTAAPPPPRGARSSSSSSSCSLSSDPVGQPVKDPSDGNAGAPRSGSRLWVQLFSARRLSAVRAARRSHRPRLTCVWPPGGRLRRSHRSATRLGGRSA
jgi:hypothetical protein